MTNVKWFEPGDPLHNLTVPTVDFQCYHCHKTTRLIAATVVDAEVEYWRKKYSRLLSERVMSPSNLITAARDVAEWPSAKAVSKLAEELAALPPDPVIVSRKLIEEAADHFNGDMGDFMETVRIIKALYDIVRPLSEAIQPPIERAE